MIGRFMKYLGYRYAKFQFNNDVDVPQPLTEFFRNARSILIILPVGYDDAVVASEVIGFACRKLPNVHITIVHSGTRGTSLSALPRSEVIRIQPDDLNKFLLPTRRVMKRVMMRSYDVAMNLNLDFVLHTAYICKASRAKVRVGSTHPAADVFYNVQLNLKKKEAPQVRYQQFAACLSMF